NDTNPWPRPNRPRLEQAAISPAYANEIASQPLIFRVFKDALLSQVSRGPSQMHTEPLTRICESAYAIESGTAKHLVNALRIVLHARLRVDTLPLRQRNTNSEIMYRHILRRDAFQMHFNPGLRFIP